MGSEEKNNWWGNHMLCIRTVWLQAVLNPENRGGEGRSPSSKTSWFKHALFRRKGLGAAYNATMPSQNLFWVKINILQGKRKKKPQKTDTLIWWSRLGWGAGAARGGGVQLPYFLHSSCGYSARPYWVCGNWNYRNEGEMTTSFSKRSWDEAKLDFWQGGSKWGIHKPFKIAVLIFQ